MWTESWLKCHCDHCGAVNWYCQGDLSDCTGVDAEALRCHSCKNLNYFLDPTELRDIHGEDLDNLPTEDVIYIEDGKANP